MSQLTSRRAFLSARTLQEDRSIVRPPGSVVPGFADLCTKCGDCVEACPESVIVIGSDGFPVLHAVEGPCTFCGDCAQACPTDALQIERLADWPWRATLQTASCLSMNGVSCRVCQDNCEQNAISFRLQPGGNAEPSLDANACTGCGACVALCPVDAVAMRRQTTPQTETTQ
ncbi:ferredoxin-type protein NapF [Ruegeria lacuscaerulensis]|uniref:ferredoxin-type protein NapF n=1 Tax=Ruegeria lacuscaerulensis TaxID=55218 RepID=UPI00147C3FD1|nr:ferredoxin-type protein NapF [Ruegeria lacuscaerulensis]